MTGKTRWIILGVILTPLVFLAVATAWASGPAQGEVGTQAALGTAFTYQGQLKKGSDQVSGDCEMAFRLYDQETMGSQVGSAITKTVSISNSLFTVKLDFGSGVFNGDARWLGIKVKCPGDTDYVDLGRQELTAAPYALYAASTGALQGRPITTTAPAAGQVLGWNGSMWGPTTTPGDAAISRPGFSITTLDSIGGDVNSHDTSVAIGVDGLGLISYYDATNGAMKVAHCNDIACASANAYTIDDADNVGYQASITIGADGLGLISYYDVTNGAMKVAHCNDIACASANAYIIDNTGSAQADTSIAIGADGLGLISYYDGINTALKVAHCNNTACASANTYTIDSEGDVGGSNSITIGTDGLGLISYKESRPWAGDLRVAHCSDIACTSAITHTIDSADDVGGSNSITIGSDGLGLISYHLHDIVGGNWGVKVAHCSDTICTSADTYVVDISTIPDLGHDTSITIGSDGMGLISYHYGVSSNWGLKVAHCNNIACSNSSTYVLDKSSTGSVGLHTSITIGTDGMALISYFDDTNNNLKVAHCSNVFCTPYFRRR